MAAELIHLPAKTMKLTVPSATKMPKAAFPRSDYDCYFSVEGCRIGAHRQLLAAHSGVFADRFIHIWAGLADIPIESTTFDAFTQLVDYFYSGVMKVNVVNVAAILHLAHEFDVEPLFGVCSKVLCANVGGIGGVIVSLGLAVQYQLGVKYRLLDVISKNTVAAFGSVEFLECNNATLCEMLDDNQLRCSPETIFDECIRWAQHKCATKLMDADCPQAIRRELGKCFELIEFKAMRVDAFIRRYEAWHGLFRRSEADDIFLYICRNHSRQITELRARRQ